MFKPNFLDQNLLEIAILMELIFKYTSELKK